MSIKLTGESMQKKEGDYTYGFFGLKNNHDKAVVRFMHQDYEDFSRRPVHFVKVPGQKYSVSINCLRADGAPESDCPFCGQDVPTEKVSKRSKRIYIEFLVYKILDRNGQIIQDFSGNPKRMVWERERRFDDKIFSLSSRYNPLCNTVFQVERFGEAGSKDTTYDIYPIAVDEAQYPFTLPDNLYDPDGIQVEDRTADEMNYYLENDYKFPPSDDEGGVNEQVTRRSDVAAPAQQPAPVYRQPVSQPTSAAPAQEYRQPNTSADTPWKQEESSAANNPIPASRRRSI